MRWGLILCAAIVGCTEKTAAPKASPAASASAPPPASAPAASGPSSIPKYMAGDPDNAQLSSAGAARAPLTPDQLKGVVQSHMAEVRRTCLRPGSGATNERVAITIDGNGDVTNASARGNDTAAGACLEKEIQNWTFPPTGAQTRTVLPFALEP